jgi:hypothetical protein
MLKPFSEKLWSLSSTETVDLAIGIDQCPRGTGGSDRWTPGDKLILKDFETFAERNAGTDLWNFHRQLVHELATFAPLVAEHIYNNVATPEEKVVNDQNPFRTALYLFKRLKPEFNEQMLPMHTSCRTYPGAPFAGIDGFKNGMYPFISDAGERCAECYCTPCLIGHTAKSFTINGKMGWEEDFEYTKDYPNSV